MRYSDSSDRDLGDNAKVSIAAVNADFLSYLKLPDGELVKFMVLRLRQLLIYRGSTGVAKILAKEPKRTKPIKTRRGL